MQITYMAFLLTESLGICLSRVKRFALSQTSFIIIDYRRSDSMTLCGRSSLGSAVAKGGRTNYCTSVRDDALDAVAC